MLLSLKNNLVQAFYHPLSAWFIGTAMYLKFLRILSNYYLVFSTGWENLNALSSSQSIFMQLVQLYRSLLDYICIVLLTNTFILFATQTIFCSFTLLTFFTSFITNSGTFRTWFSANCLFQIYVLIDYFSLWQKFSSSRS